jgi:hypothetical protein
MIPEVWVWLLTTGAAVGAITLYGIATVTVRLGDEAMEIITLGVAFRTIPYADIQSVDRGGSFFRQYWLSFRVNNRVTLQLRPGKRRKIVINPPDPDAFLLDLRSRLHAGPPGRTD